jgi:protein involved in polysaccharide export with SLBB domain
MIQNDRLHDSILIGLLVTFVAWLALPVARPPQPVFRMSRGVEYEPPPPLKVPASIAELDDVLIIKPGYKVAIQIVEDKREPLQQRVAVTGEIQAPYLGLMKVDGLTCRKLANKIKAGLEREFFARATVLVAVRVDSFQKVSRGRGLVFVVVFGSVARGGKYDVRETEEETVSDLLSRAGGYTGSNSVPKITIHRETPAGYRTILVDTNAIFLLHQVECDLFLRMYDVMIVE